MPQNEKPPRVKPATNDHWLVVLTLCLCGFLLGAFLVASQLSFAQAPATAAPMPWHERVTVQAAAVWSVIVQTSEQILAGVPLQIAQVGSAPPVELGGVPLATSGTTISGLPLASLGGTLRFNTPLEIDNNLQVFGTSTFATTTVTGPLLVAGSLAVADAASFTTLTATGGATLTTLSVPTTATIGTLSVLGNGTLASLLVTSDIDTAGLVVTGESVLDTLGVTGSATFGGLVSLTSLLTATGGIETRGANIDAGTGSIFAANIVNQLRAGDNVSITGTRSEPIISIDTDDLVGVLSINDQTGNIDLVGGTDISISGVTIFNTATLSSVRGRGGCAGCITDADVSPVLTIQGGSIDDTPIGSTTASRARFTEVVIGTTTSATTLTVGGGVAVSDILTVSGTATSTFSGSINLLSGCFAINGVCVEGIAPSSYVGLTDTPGSLLANAIQFANASGTALTQTADFVFAGGRLGIGTSAPSDSLTVVGDMSLSGAFRDGLGSAGLDGSVLQSTGTSTRWVSAATFGDGTFLGLSDTPSTFATGSIPFVNASASALTQSSGLVFDGSNLGVGTGTPFTRLTVAGGDLSITSANALRWYNAATTQYVGFRASSTLAATTVWTLPTADGTPNQLMVTDGSGNLRFANISSIGGGATTYLELLDTPSSFATGSIPFVNASSTALSQASSFVFRGGNLGVGVTDPTARLTVEGSVRLQVSSSQLGLSYGAAGNRFGFGTENPTEFVTIQRGSLLQRGGTLTNTYQPSAIASLPLVGNVEDIDIVGNFAYAVSSSGGANFFVVDITNPTNPLNVASLNLPSGALSIQVVGQYAYVGGTFAGAGFFIVDITNPLSPVLVNSVSVSTDVRDIIVSGQYAYLAVGNALRVFDISNPLSPFAVASTTVTDNINGLALAGNFMYAVSAIGGTHFHVINVSDPTSLAAPIANLNFGAAANDIDVRGTYAYVVTSNSVDTLRIVNISNPASPVVVATEGLGTTGNTIELAGRYAYVGTQAVGNTFYVLDVNNPLDPQIVGSRDLAAGNLLGMEIKGRYAYVVSSNINDRLHVVDVTGAELQSALVHSLEGGYLAVQGDSQIAGRLVAGLGLQVGNEGIQTTGELSVLSTGASQIAGRLSIGTSSALYQLTIAGSLGLTGAFHDRNGSAGLPGMILQSTGTGVQWVATSTLSAGSSLFTDSGATTFLTSPLSNFSIGTTSALARLAVQSQGTSDILNLFETGGQEVFTVLENGNVGIGSTTPGERLVILGNNGGLAIDGDNFAETTLRVINSGGSGNLKLEAGSGGLVTVANGLGNGGLSIELVDNSLYNSLTIARFNTDQDDRYAIQISNQAGNTIAGFTGRGKLLTGTSSALAQFNVQTTGTTDILNLFETGGQEVFTVLENGNVGIGSTTPGSLLVVNGTSTFNGQVAASSFSLGGPLQIINSAGNLNLSGGRIQFSGTNAGVRDGNLTVAGSGILAFQQGVLTTGNIGAGLSIIADGVIAVGNGLHGNATGTLIAGNIGIGTTTPTERLTVVGTIQSTVLLGGVTDLQTDAQGNIIRGPSDERLKQNVTTIENPLEILLGLRGVRYEWIDAERFGTQAEIGFIAQEVQTVLPEVVREGGEYWSLRTANIVAVVVEAVKSLWAEVRQTQTEVTELRERVEELEAQLSTGAQVTPPPPAPSVLPLDEQSGSADTGTSTTTETIPTDSDGGGGDQSSSASGPVEEPASAAETETIPASDAVIENEGVGEGSDSTPLTG